jgi:hypothetical protein
MQGNSRRGAKVRSLREQSKEHYERMPAQLHSLAGRSVAGHPFQTSSNEVMNGDTKRNSQMEGAEAHGSAY